MTTHVPPGAHIDRSGSFFARRHSRIVRIAAVAPIAVAVLLATAVFAPGLVTFVALMGGCLLMHLFGHGSHDHGVGTMPKER